MEQVKMNRLSLFGLMAILLLSSCGTFTKMRYSRGFKADFGFYRNAKEAEVPELKANKAQKKTDKKTPSISDDKRIGSIAQPSINDSLDVTLSNNIKPIQHSSKKHISKTNKNGLEHQKKTALSQETSEGKVMEPNVMAGGIAYLLGYFLLGISSFVSSIAVVIPYVGFFLFLVGFILAIIGLRKINRAPDQFKGEVLAIIIIIIFLLSIFLSIFAFLLFYALFL